MNERCAITPTSMALGLAVALACAGCDDGDPALEDGGGLDAATVDAGQPDAGSPCPAAGCARADCIVERRMRELGVQSYSFAFVLGDELCLSQEGTECSHRPAPMTAETRIRLPFLSELFTAIAVQEAAAAGHFSLDDPIEMHVGSLGFEPAAWSAEITARHLITWTAGIPVNPGLWAPSCLDAETTKEAWLESVADTSLWAPPGKIAQSDLSSNVLLGLLLERTDPEERPFAEIVRALVFEPAGLDGAQVGAPPSDMHEGFACAHRGIGVETPSPPDVPCEADEPRGGVFLGGADALRLARILLDGGLDPEGERVFTEATIEGLMTPEIPGPTEAGYARTLGLYALTGTEPQAYRFSFEGDGASGALALVPERRMGGFLLVPRRLFGFGAALAPLAEILEPELGHAIDGPSPISLSFEPHLPDFEGRFVDLDGGAVELRAEGDQLAVSGALEGSLTPSAADTFTFRPSTGSIQTGVRFWRDEEGGPAMRVVRLGPSPRFRDPPGAPSRE